MLSKMVVSAVIMAVITYIIRALPVTLINKEIKSQFLKSFLYYVPYAVLASLTFPAVFYSTGSTKASIIGTIVAVVLAYCEKGLVVVALGAILTIAICGFIPCLA